MKTTSQKIPQGWNRYTYARNNPVVRLDPDGKTDVYIDIQRSTHSETGRSTHGYISVRGTTIAGSTLELPDKQNQSDVSRIPEGTYIAKRDNGATLGPLLWITGVSGRTEIAIHAGNSPGDTKGCVLVASSCSGSDKVTSSKKKLNEVLNHVDSVIASDKAKGEKTTIHVTITDPKPEERKPPANMEEFLSRTDIPPTR